jgi:D-alanyl-D-alanine dipeptidase
MKKYFVIILLFSISNHFSQTKNNFPIPENCRQIILVLTDSIIAANGNLLYFERTSVESKWTQINSTINVVLGRNGLGWGRGLNSIDSSKLPIKNEGDGRSPAGVFKLSAAFGYASSDKMKGLKIPYLPIKELVECIDDIKSSFYNMIVSRDKIKNIDWQSSEKMYFADIWYEQGVVVEQNTNPIINGAGSCIFLHNWSKSNETTSGCTGMAPVNMKKIIYWLDSSANPVLVQLTKQLYKEYQQSWQLPKINTSNE